MENSLDSVDSVDSVEHLHREYLFRERNRRLRHSKAVLSRIESDNRKKRLYLLLTLMPLLAIMIAFSILLIDEEKFVEKSYLEQDIKNIIVNGGDLEAVKYSLNSQPDIGFFKSIFSQSDNYYNVNIPLSFVLNEIRTNSFRDDNKDIRPLLDIIITEHEEVNPFDKLQAGQKEYFVNIRIKTGEHYAKIANDINNLADELHARNMLVNDYMGDSKMSFWISIIAVIISFIMGGYQIFSARPEALKKLFVDAVEQQASPSDTVQSKRRSSDVANKKGPKKY